MTAPFSALLLGIGLATIAPGVAPPLARAAPDATLPTTGLPQPASENFQVEGIANWFLVSCQPSPARLAWAITSSDSQLAAHSGVMPTNVDTGRIGWPVAVVGAGAGGNVEWDSGGFAFTSAPAPAASPWDQFGAGAPGTTAETTEADPADGASANRWLSGW